METTKPRQTLNTVRKNSSEIPVFVKMLSKFKENEVVQICATFTRSHAATVRFLLSQNKLNSSFISYAFKGGLRAI
jgi:dihydroorotate dehydrogenase